MYVVAPVTLVVGLASPVGTLGTFVVVAVLATPLVLPDIPVIVVDNDAHRGIDDELPVSSIVLASTPSAIATHDSIATLITGVPIWSCAPNGSIAYCISFSIDLVLPVPYAPVSSSVNARTDLMAG